LGVGEGAFLDAWNQYAPIDSDACSATATWRTPDPRVLGTLGLVGLFGLMGLLLVCFWSAWKARNGELGGEARAVLAAMTGNFVCQMFAGAS